MIRLFDILSSFIIILMLSPILLIVAILVKSTSKGPIFYKDKRVGLDKKIFFMYKFRSMKVNTQDENSWYTKKNDDRITKIGKFIRETSIDELPQLFNVLNGDMSLVGPRPESPFSEKIYSIEYWDSVHLIKPGITGLAQIMGRSSLGLENKVKFDLEYTNKIMSLNVVMGILYNIKILLGTILILINRKGSN